MGQDDFACGVSASLLGQPWRWRRNGGDDLSLSLTDQLLLARGVEQSDLPRHRQPTIRDFLPDPSVFKDMDKAAKRLADAVERQEGSRSLATMTSMAQPARRCLSCSSGVLGLERAPTSLIG